MISSLKRALQLAVTDISIKFDVPPSFQVYQAPEEVPTLFSGDKVVVYGIMKKQKSVPDKSLQASVNGTATLTCQILSKPVEFKITFEIPQSCDFCSSVKIPTVHHLASKSLIHDLQSGEDWTDAATTRKQRNRIVKLSIESGVVSSYTAYIALDEGQDKLIEGAVKTWDVVATMAQPKESMSSPGQSTPHFDPSILSSSSQGMLMTVMKSSCTLQAALNTSSALETWTLKSALMPSLTTLNCPLPVNALPTASPPLYQAGPKVCSMTMMH